jgi:hypothetical protein
MIELKENVYLGNDFTIMGLSKYHNETGNTFYTIQISLAEGKPISRSCTKEEIETLIHELQLLIQ